MVDSGIEVQHLGDSVYLVRTPPQADVAFIEGVLEEVWQRPEWSQPWGLVVAVEPDTRYHPDIRNARVPADDLRAVGTAVVVQRSMQRVVINTIALGLKAISGFDLSAHDDVDEAVSRMRAKVIAVRERGAKF